MSTAVPDREDAALDGAATDRDEVVAEFTAATSALLGAIRRLTSRRPQRPGEPSLTELRLMAHLRGSEGPVSVGELARIVDLTPSTMTATIDRLEADGSVVRSRSTEDRRVVLVTLTDHGEEIFAARYAQWTEQWAVALRDIEPAELELASKALRQVTATVDEL